MDEEFRFRFWDVIVEYLVEFHHVSLIAAHQEAIELRACLREHPTPDDMIYPGEMIYHEEPFYVACKLVDSPLDLGNYFAEYTELLQKHGLANTQHSLE